MHGYAHCLGVKAVAEGVDVYLFPGVLPERVEKSFVGVKALLLRSNQVEEVVVVQKRSCFRVDCMACTEECGGDVGLAHHYCN